MKMRNKIKVAMLACAIAACLGCFGCASFSRRYIATQDVQPEQWHLFGEAFGFARAGLIKKFTYQGVIIELQASRLQQSDLIGRIVDASVTVDGTTLKKSNPHQDLAKRSVMILNTMEKDERGNNNPVPLHVPNSVEQIDVNITLEFKHPNKPETHRKEVSISLPQEARWAWVTPIEFWFGGVLD